MRKIRAGGFAWAILLILCLTPGVLRADWIQLRNGVQIHGKILRQNEDEITLKLDRGGTSSFEMKTVLSVHRLEPETRKKLELDPDSQNPEPLTTGIHPRPDAVRSARRPVPGGTLLLPEEAVRKPLPKIEPGSAIPKNPESPQFEALYLLGHVECRIRIGRETAAPDDESQIERIRDRFTAQKGTELLALEQQRIAGLATWVSETTFQIEKRPYRRITAWVRVAENSLQVVEVELPEAIFQANPYRYRVIPRSFRPQPVRSSPAARIDPQS